MKIADFKTILFADRKARIPRLWSNAELAKFAPYLTGDVVNVSGWNDCDKQGRFYRDYFTRKDSYTITNYKSEARGLQGADNEIFLDLAIDLPKELTSRFDVVFNHTVLEHIFDIQMAFRNLCAMTSDIVILVVPFLQPMHASYGDYWRFTPLCLENLFDQHGLKIKYLSFNNHINASVYIYCVATKHPSRWPSQLPCNVDPDGKVPILMKPALDDGQTPMVGANAILNFGHWVGRKISEFPSHPLKR